MVWITLGIAIVSEVLGSIFLKLSEGMSRPLPTVATFIFYALAFFLLSIALKEIPLGVAYALWSGLGIVFTTLLGMVEFKQNLDSHAWLGICFILAGVVLLNLNSHSGIHS